MPQSQSIDQIIDRLENQQELAYDIGVDDLHDSVCRPSDHQWEINYYGAACKIESPSPDEAIVHHLKVPESIQGRGIGTALLQLSEELIREETDASVLYVSIGAPTPATRHIVSNKCGFTVNAVFKKDGLGRVLEGEKQV